MLGNFKSSSVVIVTISSKPMPSCNLFHAKFVDIKKNRSFSKNAYI